MPKPFGAVVAQCPSCRRPIGGDHPYLWCADCGAPFSQEVLQTIPSQKQRIDAELARQRSDDGAATSAQIADHRRVTVVDVDIPFVSMVVMLVKLALAAIPAILILSIIGAMMVGVVGATLGIARAH